MAGLAPVLCCLDENKEATFWLPFLLALNFSNTSNAFFPMHSTFFAPVCHMFDISGIEFGSTKRTPFSQWQWGKGHTHWLHKCLQCKTKYLKIYVQISLFLWVFASWIWFGVAWLPRWGSAALHACTAHAANCAARQYLFGFDETMPLATNHKFSSTQSQRLIYHITEMISEREMPW